MAKRKTTIETFGYTVRFPKDLHDDLDLLSRYNYRSLNSEIVIAVQEHLEKNREILDAEKQNASANA